MNPFSHSDPAAGRRVVHDMVAQRGEDAYPPDLLAAARANAAADGQERDAAPPSDHSAG